MMASFLEERPEIVDKIVGKDMKDWDSILMADMATRKENVFRSGNC
jgi:hypothetical protein